MPECGKYIPQKLSSLPHRWNFYELYGLEQSKIALPRWRSCCTYSLLLLRKMYNMPWLFEATVPDLGTMNHLPGLWMWERPRSIEGSQTSMGCCESCFATWLIYFCHQIQCCVKYLWQIRFLYGAYCRTWGESQGRALVLYLKTMPSCANNYYPFFFFLKNSF